MIAGIRIKPYHLFPFLLPGILLLVDHIFLLDAVHLRMVSFHKIEPDIYRLREELRNDLEDRIDQNSNYPYALIFGSSRSAGISPKRAENQTRELHVYNFSAPLATSPYFLYHLTEILKQKTKPKFILLEMDEINLARRTENYPLRYSLSASFVLKHSFFTPGVTTRFTGEEMERFFLFRMFSLFRYPLEFKTIRESFREIPLPRDDPANPGQLKIVKMTGAELRMQMIDQIRYANSSQGGAVPGVPDYERTEQEIKRETPDAIQKLNLDPYYVSNTERIFTEEIIRVCESNEIPLFVYRPPISEPLRNRLRQLRLYNENNRAPKENLEDALRNLVLNMVHGEQNRNRFVHYLDLREETSFVCSNWADPHHLSGSCMKVMGDYLLNSVSASLNGDSTEEL